jgi:hypothetical protein
VGGFALIDIAREQQTEPTFLTRIKTRARRRIEWLREESSTSMVPEEKGMAIGRAEVDRILRRANEAPGVAEATVWQATPPVGVEEVAEADASFAADQAWSLLAREFGLNRFEIDLLSLALAIQLEPDLDRVYAFLQDDPSNMCPTPALAASLFDWNRIAPFGPGSSLIWWSLARPVENAAEPWSPSAGWVAEAAISTWLLGGAAIDAELVDGLRLTDPSIARLPCLHDEVLARLCEFVDSITRGGRVSSIAIEIIGPSGSGRRTLAAQLASVWQFGLLVADAGTLLQNDLAAIIARQRVRKCMRSARLENALLCWHVDSDVDPGVWQSMLSLPALTIFVSERPVLAGSQPGCAHFSISLGPLKSPERDRFWASLSTEPFPPDLGAWSLTPSQLKTAAEAEPAGRQAIIDACRRSLRRNREDLLVPLGCPYVWDDIILEPSIERHLREFEAQARHRWEVLHGWGFARLSPLHLGVSAMFAGPSGTGKTMAAQVIARSLGMELLRVDLAGVVNKYIGETEKRLKRVFDACEQANVVLLFDEADALFGRRTQVKDAHDRFANIEIDYLLQRMERFDGIAILATNRRSDVDQAFLRRLGFVIDFMPPGPRERLTLWTLALPPALVDGTRLTRDIDFDYLAQRLSLTGAGIKSAAIAAAFLARSQESQISMQHVLHAARRELAKNGFELRAEVLEA